MKAEDVAEFMLQAAREFMPADERRDPDAESLARELLVDEMGPVIMRMCILAHNAGVKRGLELAKEHASAVCCHECGECGGEGYVDDEEVEGDDDCPQCEGKGDRADKVAIDWSAADEAVEKEGK